MHSVRRLLLLLLVVACAPAHDERAMSLSEGWTFTSESRTTPPGEDARWRDEVRFETERDLWFRNRVPGNAPADASLVFRSYLGTFSLFVEQQPIYTFDDRS